ncbi:hypothetical protein GCM10017673_42700 [Streptosporangium violaceochromogenes]|nr:hypothetical protein GCM10017673_42700 [Streptosporangium violaceochromogenes]
MKKQLMRSRFGLASARPGAFPSLHGQALLADGVATQLRREQSVQTQVPTGRPRALTAFAATGVVAVPAPGAGYAPTKHIARGGSRGPYPWRQPPVIT